MKHFINDYSDSYHKLQKNHWYVIGLACLLYVFGYFRGQCSEVLC